MFRATIWLAIGTSLIASCFPSATGPGFRRAPEEIRGPDWSELCGRLQATVTLVDLVTEDYHVRVAHLPEGNVEDHVVPHGRVLSATSIPGEEGAYCLLQHSPVLVLPYYDIVRLKLGTEGTQLFVGKGHIDISSSISLAPDGSTMAFIYRVEKAGEYASGPSHLALIDTRDGHWSDVEGEFSQGTPLWTRDSRSLLISRECAGADAAPEIVRCRVPADGNPEVIARGHAPLLAADGNSLLFFQYRGSAAHWCTLDGSPAPDPLTLSTEVDWRRVLAVGPEFVFAYLTEPDPRLPLECTGYLMVAPKYRGGISVGTLSSRVFEPLFVGVAPFALEWRWD